MPRKHDTNRCWTYTLREITPPYHIGFPTFNGFSDLRVQISDNLGGCPCIHKSDSAQHALPPYLFRVLTHIQSIIQRQVAGFVGFRDVRVQIGEQGGIRTLITAAKSFPLVNTTQFTNRNAKRTTVTRRRHLFSSFDGSQPCVQRLGTMAQERPVIIILLHKGSKPCVDGTAAKDGQIQTDTSANRASSSWRALNASSWAFFSASSFATRSSSRCFSSTAKQRQRRVKTTE